MYRDLVWQFGTCVSKIVYTCGTQSRTFPALIDNLMCFGCLTDTWFYLQPDLLGNFFTKQEVNETVAAIKELKIPRRWAVFVFLPLFWPLSNFQSVITSVSLYFLWIESKNRELLPKEMSMISHGLVFLSAVVCLISCTLWMFHVQKCCLVKADLVKSKYLEWPTWKIETYMCLVWSIFFSQEEASRRRTRLSDRET